MLMVLITFVCITGLRESVNMAKSDLGLDQQRNIYNDIFSLGGANWKSQIVPK